MLKSLVYLRFCKKMLILCFNESLGNSQDIYLKKVVFIIWFGQMFGTDGNVSITLSQNKDRYIKY